MREIQRWNQTSLERKVTQFIMVASDFRAKNQIAQTDQDCFPLTCSALPQWFSWGTLKNTEAWLSPTESLT